MPEDMRRVRNRSIIMVLIQVLLAVGSIMLWERRRNRFILAATIASILFSMIGVYGTIRINTVAMFAHSFYCCSFLGAFYIYLILDFLLFDNTKNPDGSTKLSDTAIMFLLSIPFLGVFIIGIHSMYLFNMVYDERKARQVE